MIDGGFIFGQKEPGRTCHSERSEESLEATDRFFASLRMTCSTRPDD